MSNLEQGIFTVRAELYRDEETGVPFATGTAIETPTSGQVNRQGFALENAETSSIGRALQNAGIVTKISELRPEEIERIERVNQAPPLRSPASTDQKCEQTAKAPLPGGWTIDEWRVTKAKGKILDMEAATGLPQVKCRDWLEQNFQTREPWLCDVDQLTSYGHWLVAQTEKSI